MRLSFCFLLILFILSQESSAHSNYYETGYNSYSDDYSCSYQPDESPYFWGLVRVGLGHLYRRYLVPIGVTLSANYLQRKIDNYVNYSAERYNQDPYVRRDVHHVANEWAYDKDYNSAMYHVPRCQICSNTANYLAQ